MKITDEVLQTRIEEQRINYQSFIEKSIKELWDIKSKDVSFDEFVFLINPFFSECNRRCIKDLMELFTMRAKKASDENAL